MTKLVPYLMVALLLAVVCRAESETKAHDHVMAVFERIERQMRDYTEPETFSKLLAEAREALPALSEDPATANCRVHFERAMAAYDIVEEIWLAQGHDDAIETGYACLPVERYARWLREFPALLTWKWGLTGVGVSTLDQALFEPLNCCLILKPWFDDVWAPCLFHEARQKLSRAARCMASGER